MIETTLPEVNFNWLVTKIEKLNKRAAKLGCPLATVEIVSREARESEHDGQLYVKNFVTVQVTGEAPRLDGWTFAAKVTPLDGGNLVNLLPGVQSIPEHFRTSTMFCDHCKTNRRRNEVFVLRSDAGAYIQVGRNCLADYTRGASAEIAAQMAEYFCAVKDAVEASEGMDSYNYRGEIVAKTEEFVATAAAVIRCEGWTSRTKAREDYGSYATADRTWDLLFRKEDLARFVGRFPDFAVTDADYTFAREAIAWASDLEAADNDYLANLRLVASQEVTRPVSIGVLASIVQAYNRRREEVAREARCTNAYVGKVGDKIKGLVVTCEACIALDGYYGVSFINKLYDAAGNLFVWKTSSFDGVVGQQYTINGGSIKAHVDYNGEKQTELQRCKIA